MATTLSSIARTTAALLLVSCLLCLPRSWAFVLPNDATTIQTPITATTRKTNDKNVALHMGMVDSIFSRFRKKAQEEGAGGDFVRLQEMKDQFLGPGPVVLMYQFPDGIDNDEVRDMLFDGAPKATKQGISMARIASMVLEEKEKGNKSKNLDLVDLSLQKALETVMDRSKNEEESTIGAAASVPFSQAPAQIAQQPPPQEGSPVVIFSGFTNGEMMDSYNILGEELYKETMSSYGKGQYLACATAVPNAMKKPLRQVLEEISGDHALAMQGPPQ